MEYRYVTVDVFTGERFGGNPLAVLPDARGLTDAQMLAVTREFGYSETAFVLPPESAHARFRLRIFTPAEEIPFAGHPTIGSAYVLAGLGLLEGEQVVLEEGAGLVRVDVAWVDRRPGACTLWVPRLPETRPAPSAAVLAEVLSLARADIGCGPGYAPEAVSCGLPFLLVPVASIDAVRRARVRVDAWERELAGSWASEPMVFALGGEGAGSDVHARVFCPGLSVPEDPATGSAAAALGGYLASRSGRRAGTLRWRVEQGLELGRPSLLDVAADRRGGATTAVRVGGEAVLVCTGMIRV